MTGIASGGSKQSASTSSNNNNQQRTKPRPQRLPNLTNWQETESLSSLAKALPAAKQTVGQMNT